MGTILWIDQNTFASNLIEKVFKKKGIPFYTLTLPRDFAYLIEDLKPSVVVLDGKTCLGHLDDFKAEWDRSPRLQHTPLITIGDHPELSFLQKAGTLTKPLDPFTVPEKIRKILGMLN